MSVYKLYTEQLPFILQVFPECPLNASHYARQYVYDGKQKQTQFQQPSGSFC